MNHVSSNPDTFEAKAASIGLPVATLTPAGAVAKEHALPGPLFTILNSRFVARRLADATAAWNDQQDPQPAEILPGLTLLPFVRTERRRRSAYVVACQVAPTLFTTEEFAAACQSAAIDAQAAASALANIATHNQSHTPRNLLLFRWLAEDQDAIANSDDAVASFSSQLSEAYEELHLLYNLGRAMNEFIHPARFVTHLLTELRATLPYTWVLVAFVRNDPRVPLSGQCYISSSQADDADERRLRIAAQRFLIPLNQDSPSVLSMRAFTGDDSFAEHDQVLVQPVTREGKLLAAVMAGQKTCADPDVSSGDIKLLTASASYLSVLLENASLYDDQQATFIGTLRALTAAIDAKDRYTRGHSDRVAHVTRLLAQASGLDPATVERMHIAGLVHDVGKIGVPETVLRKPGRLTDEEFDLIKLHPEIGHNILKGIPQLGDILPGVLYHHERWDGRGYPHNLKSDAIPHVARLIALADAFDAMSSTRTYRPAMPRDRVLAEIEKNAGVQFDPDLARIFVTLDFTQYDHMVARDAPTPEQPPQQEAA